MTKMKENTKTTLNLRIDSDLKNEAEKVIDELGLSTSTAVVLFLKAVVRHNGLPFDVRLTKAKNERKTRPSPQKKATAKRPKKQAHGDSLMRAIDKL